MSAVRKPVWREDFAGGLDLVQRWALMVMDEFVADDGVVETGRDGLRLTPPGSHPSTGEPAFTKDGPGVLGRVKWFASTRQTFPTGPAPLRIAFRACCRAYGIGGHPYGDAVAEPALDPRLASFVVNVMDIETGMVFDLTMSHGAIYPVYERIALPGVGNEGFISVRDPILRIPADVHDLAIEIDGPAGTATWEVDGTVVGAVSEVGLADPEWTTIVHLPGSRAVAVPNQVVVSFGFFTLPDAALPPSTGGLNDLGLGYAFPKVFAGGRCLFGQGMEGHLERIDVSHG